MRPKKYKKREERPFRLREVLQRTGVSLGELSRRTGIDRSCLSKYAMGRCKPTWRIAVVLSAALDVSLDELDGRLTEGKGLYAS